MHILIIEDDTDTAEYLGDSLRQQGYHCDIVHNGSDGLEQARSQTYDALVIDRMLPGLGGISIVRQLRGEGNHTPCLFLTAMSDVNDRVEGLRAGADDYLTKPFAMAELHARVEALIRRQQNEQGEALLTLADLTLDRLARTVTRGDNELRLRTREFELLEYLMTHQGQLVTRTMLLEQVWHYHFDPQTNVIDVHISRLRNKLQEHGGEPLLHTLRGQGYSLHD